MLAKQFLAVAAMAAGAMAQSVETAIDGTVASAAMAAGSMAQSVVTSADGTVTGTAEVATTAVTAGAASTTHAGVFTTVATRTGTVVGGAATATARAGSTGHAGGFTTVGTVTGTVTGTRAGSVFVEPTSTISAFVGDGLVFAAALPGGAPCSTLLAVDCYANGLQDALYCAQAVSFGVNHITLTAHPAGLEASNNISTRGEIRSYSVGCHYHGYNDTLSAWASEVCTVSLSASVEGLVTRTSTVITSTTPIAKQRVLVTAGAAFLPTGIVCTASGAAAPTVLAGVYKLLVPGAAIAAGVAML